MSVIRDPIHGDILLDPVVEAIIDHAGFQRLRYIRQNAFLHIIFPGAMHTRFIHSIGTMSLASRLFDELFLDALQQPASDEIQSSTDYVRLLFRTAALLHDVGHGAFSHSIESLKRDDGSPFIGTVGELAKKWDVAKLVDEHLDFVASDSTERETRTAAPADHELIGMIIADKICSDTRVVSAVNEGFSSRGSQFAADVNALLENTRPGKALVNDITRFLSGLKATTDGRLSELASEEKEVEHTLSALHGLISGTFDVDRMDYLARDARNCGVAYGAIDTDFLLRSFRAAEVAGRLKFVIRENAIHALEDFLWSRYQMFLQVYGHKTNVGLNAVVSKVLPEAESEAVFDAPDTLEKYLTFTDDYVMSNLFNGAYRGKLKGRPYTRALVYRELPTFLGFTDLAGLGYDHDKSGAVARARQKKATECGIDEANLLSQLHTSAFVKVGRLPTVTTRNKLTGQEGLADFGTVSSLVGSKSLPPACDYLYFYTYKEASK